MLSVVMLVQLCWCSYAGVVMLVSLCRMSLCPLFPYRNKPECLSLYLIFTLACKTRSLPLEKNLVKDSTRVGSSLVRKYYICVKVMYSEKRSSLLRNRNNYGCKKLYRTGRWIKSGKKLFMSISTPTQAQCRKTFLSVIYKSL